MNSHKLSSGNYIGQ
jgi:hypothetical protein